MLIITQSMVLVLEVMLASIVDKNSYLYIAGLVIFTLIVYGVII